MSGVEWKWNQQNRPATWRQHHMAFSSRRSNDFGKKRVDWKLGVDEREKWSKREISFRIHPMEILIDFSTFKLEIITVISVQWEPHTWLMRQSTPDFKFVEWIEKDGCALASRGQSVIDWRWCVKRNWFLKRKSPHASEHRKATADECFLIVRSSKINWKQ